MANELSAEKARELFVYDPGTGALVSRKDGRPRGTKNQGGYLVVSVFGRLHYVHRLAVLISTGQWPVGQVDHIDGSRANNRWANLRDAECRINAQNRHVPRSDNRSGLLGVSPNRTRFRSEIKTDGERRYLGTFDTPEEAHSAYLTAKRQLHAGCTI